MNAGATGQSDDPKVPPGFEFVRAVDFAALRQTANPGELAGRTVLGHDSGAEKCLINAFVLPPEQGSPVGWHTHAGEQIFYIVRGRLVFEAEGGRHVVEQGSLLITPAGLPHRNWNEGPDDVHLISFNTPLPDPSLPIAVPVEG